ncbi:MAG: hypothetical protein V9F03_05510 [Microthrixaceae bacterium]
MERDVRFVDDSDVAVTVGDDPEVSGRVGTAGRRFTEKRVDRDDQRRVRAAERDVLIEVLVGCANGPLQTQGR